MCLEEQKWLKTFHNSKEINPTDLKKRIKPTYFVLKEVLNNFFHFLTIRLAKNWQRGSINLLKNCQKIVSKEIPFVKSKTVVCG